MRREFALPRAVPTTQKLGSLESATPGSIRTGVSMLVELFLLPTRACLLSRCLFDVPDPAIFNLLALECFRRNDWLKISGRQTHPITYKVGPQPSVVPFAVIQSSPSSNSNSSPSRPTHISMEDT
jgi:hypothetical protein